MTTGRFGKLGAARIGKALYFAEGSYIVRIEKLLFKPNRNGRDMFIIETEVMESSNADRPVGCKPSQVIPMDQDAAWGNIKQFLGAVFGMADPDTYVPDDGSSVGDWWERQAEHVISDAQPLKGIQMKLVCTKIQTRAGNDFTKHEWGEVIAA